MVDDGGAIALCFMPQGGIESPRQICQEGGMRFSV